MLLPKAEVFMKPTCLDSIRLGTTELNQNEIAQSLHQGRKLKHCHPNLVGEDAKFAHGHVIFPVTISKSVCTLLLGGKRVPVSLSWERSQLSFLQMPVCCPIVQCCESNPKMFVFLRFSQHVSLSYRSCCHFFKLCNYCFASLKGGQQRKIKIKFIHH